MDARQQILNEFEVLSPTGIQNCFQNGVGPNDTLDGKPLFTYLINMYLRGPAFKDCVRIFVDHGLHFEDKVLLAVLLDDADMLDHELTNNKAALAKRYSFDCTFTPLFQVSLLHICAEYNLLACAKMLVQHGIDINARAGIDEHGFGAHTPVFHTVNQHANSCLDVMNFLILQGADLTVTVKGLIWGKGYEWETFIPGVNPISYAMMGLLRQFQRTEQQIYEVVAVLLAAAYHIDYVPVNLPNKYLYKNV